MANTTNFLTYETLEMKRVHVKSYTTKYKIGANPETQLRIYDKLAQESKESFCLFSQLIFNYAIRSESL